MSPHQTLTMGDEYIRDLVTGTEKRVIHGDTRIVGSLEVTGTLTNNSQSVGEAVEVAVLSRSVTLNNAQIKALPTTPVEIIPAPGAGKVIFPIGGFLHHNWVADYAGIDASCQLRLIVLTTDLLNSLREDVGSQVSSLLAGGGPDGTNGITSVALRTESGQMSGIGFFYDSDIMNQALFISAENGAVNFTGGNAGNSLQVTVLYTIIDV